MHRCLIANTKAGAVRQNQDQIGRLAAKHSCEVYRTDEAGGVNRCCQNALARGCRRIIVAGGDGTIHKVLNAIAPQFDVELAILPFGTGNDLARSLDVPPEEMDSAMHTAFSDRVEAIDLIKIQAGQETTFCINVANGGFGGQVAEDVGASDKQRWGRMSYWMTSVSQLANLDEYLVRLEMDDKSMETSTYGVAVANGRFVGGGFPIAPYALLNDGFMDVTVLPMLPAVELMAAGMNYLLTRDHRNDRVHMHRVKRLHLTSEPAMPFSVDGEPIRPFDAVFEVVPAAIRIVTGEAPLGFLDADANDNQNDLPPGSIPRLLA